MSIFAVIAPSEASALTDAMTREFGQKAFEFAPGQWVASADGLTTQQVANKIGDKGEVGQIVVFAIGAHWGYHRKDLWEWLSANGE